MERTLLSATLRINHLRSFGTSNLPQTTDLLQTYHGLVTLGKIQYDAEQIRVVMQLRRIQKELDGYAPPALTSHYLTGSSNQWQSSAVRPAAETDPVSEKPWWQSDGKAEASDTNTKALGLLLIGPPGSGKSFLIDLWLRGLPTPYKARKHYSELVLEVYRAVWEETKSRMATEHAKKPGEASINPAVPWNRNVRETWKNLLASGSLPSRWMRMTDMSFSSVRGSSPQPTIPFVVAQRLLLRHWLLVFDEVQLLDVSSATLLADVLFWYWRMGGILVGTSNKVPEDLYQNGVQRERLEPFVEALKERCPVVTLSAGKDWREARADSGNDSQWYTSGQEAQFEQKLRKISEVDGEEWSEHHLTVFGRRFRVPRASARVCHFKFSELCEQDLGTADYITLAATFHTVAISSIPGLTLSMKNQARRFISLIDALYEARCKLVCLAHTEPNQLFFADKAEPTTIDNTDVMMVESIAETRDVYRPNVSSYDTLGMGEAPMPPNTTVPLETLSLFSGKDEQFAFKRALSRMKEMTSEAYWLEEEWSPLPSSSRKWEEFANAAAAPPSYGELANEASGQHSPARAVARTQTRPNIHVRTVAPHIRETYFWRMKDE
ncbi:hypothetical protein EIP91_011601 [Steccherinum ochraceum]|uniref:AAA+ ATPase domain-containing protein n=1 Tax=Steccherinum ochraceum TaxID=92696 RepID=A0A4R0RKJ2_9APHY|nr:hypothetical protein EIP91_011601 [Steccherinum ochraceum]